MTFEVMHMTENFNVELPLSISPVWDIEIKKKFKNKRYRDIEIKIKDIEI